MKLLRRVPWRWVLVGYVAWMGALVLAGRAHAADPVCPDAPPAYTGADDTAAQVHALREDLVAVCVLVHDDAGKARTAAAGQADRAHDDQVAIRNALEAVTAALPGRDAEHPAYSTSVDEQPTSQTVALSADDRQRIDDASAAVNGSVWVLIGSLVGLPFVFFLLRAVLP